MYYYISGKYVRQGENFIVIDANGIGFKIFTSAITIENLPPVGNDITVFTHFYVKEDVQDLYGFLTNEERNLFLQLLSVSGVGPKAALAVLSVVTCEQFAYSVITNDIKTITKAQGVGPKVAQRIILELRDKVKNADALPENFKEVSVGQQNNCEEAITALTVLGYTSNEAKRAVSKVDPESDVETIIKEALKILIKQV